MRNLFCDIRDLANESDVEQSFVRTPPRKTELSGPSHTNQGVAGEPFGRQIVWRCP